MKNIILVIFCCLIFNTILRAQTGWLTQGNTTLSKDDTKSSNFTLVAVQDSTGGGTDSLVCEAYDEFIGWMVYSIQKMTGDIWETTIVPGDGQKAYYLVNYPTPVKIRIRKINTLNLTSKTKVSITHIRVQ